VVHIEGERHEEDNEKIEFDEPKNAREKKPSKVEDDRDIDKETKEEE
jgi:hypothetical protein